MRLQIDEDLKGVDFVGFQCALLYTSPKGDRRIRVHTMALPVTTQLQDVYNNADGNYIIRCYKFIQKLIITPYFFGVQTLFLYQLDRLLTTLISVPSRCPG